MTIPMATTTITVKGRIQPEPEIDPDAEGYDAPETRPGLVILATEVRACISLPNGRRADQAQEAESYALRADRVDGGGVAYDLTHHMIVYDNDTELEYMVETVQLSGVEVFGLDHYKAKLIRLEGLSPNANPAG